MALNPHLSAAAASVLATSGADGLCALLDGGSVLLLDGTQPATADTAITTQTLLAECAFADPAFTAAVAGVAAAHALTDDDDAAASGDATWCRALTSGGDPVFDGSVGISDADCVLSSVSIVMHGTVSITSSVITVTVSTP
jgi:hypothetical protein